MPSSVVAEGNTPADNGGHPLHTHVSILPPLELYLDDAPERPPLWTRIWVITKRLLPSVTAIFLASLFTAVRPIAFLSGTASFAFLILVAYTLFYHAGGATVGKHIETTVIGLAGAAVGMGWSILAIELGCISNRSAGNLDSIGARAIPAVFLAVASFVAGMLRSRFPILSFGCLLCMFVVIWLLGTSVTLDEIDWPTILGMTYSIVFAAALSLLSVLALFPVTANAVLAKQLNTALSTACLLLLASVRYHEAIADDLNTKVLLELFEHVTKTRADLAEQATRLQTTFHDTRFELTYALLPPDGYGMFIRAIDAIRTILASRFGIEAADDADKAARAENGVSCLRRETELRKSTDQLVSVIMSSIQYTRKALADASGISKQPILGAESPILASSAAAAMWAGLPGKGELTSRRLQDVLQSDIESLRAAMDREVLVCLRRATLSEHGAVFQPQYFKDYLLLTSLLDLSSTVDHMLASAASLPRSAEGHRKRLWLSWIMTSHKARPSSDDAAMEDSEADFQEQQRDGRHSRQRRLSVVSTSSPAIKPDFPRKSLSRRLMSVPGEISRLFRNRISSPVAMRRRLALSSVISHIKHSPHLKHGIKTAFGLSMLSIPGHLAENSAGRAWYTESRANWIGISFLYCYQTTTGATFRVAVYRTLGTLLGALYALAGHAISQGSPYGLVAFMTAQSLFTDYLIVFRPRFANLGTVAQITVPAILWIPYLGLSTTNVVTLAFTRAYDIEIGILAALIISVSIWPYHARLELVRKFGKISDNIAKLYLSMSTDNLRHIDCDHSRKVHETMLQQFTLLERRIQHDLIRARSLCTILHLELALIPIPTDQLNRIASVMDRLSGLFFGLRSTRLHIPREVAVLSVLPHRADLVSAVLLNLHAISHAFYMHAPLPQFLPDARSALQKLIMAVQTHIKTYAQRNDLQDRGNLCATSKQELVDESQPQHVAESDLARATVYILAESEALSQIVDSVENLLSLTRELYGVADFIQAEEIPLMTLRPG